MAVLPTPHNHAVIGDIAETVLMPGDPLRAEYIANNYLEDVICFNKVRNMFGFSGSYKGKRLSVMGSGMGMPSMGIYSYELYHFYQVDNIIRIGSIGGIADKVKLRDIVIAMGASTNSNYASQYGLSGVFAPIADLSLLRLALESAEEKGCSVLAGNILSSDIFYNLDSHASNKWKEMGILGVEMETAALYMNAAKAEKRALALFTVSDHLYTGESLTADERQVSFNEMMEIALETAVRI